MSESELPDDVDADAQEQIDAAMEAMEVAGEQERPDPSDVQPATKEDVLNQRADGELITESESVQTSNGWRTVELRRPSATLIRWFESHGDEIDTEDFAHVYARMVIDPDLPADEWKDADATMYVDLIPVIMERLEGVMQSPVVTEMAGAIDERSEGTEGN